MTQEDPVVIEESNYVIVVREHHDSFLSSNMIGFTNERLHNKILQTKNY